MNTELKVLRKMLDAVENKGFDKMCSGMCHLLKELHLGEVISFTDRVMTNNYLKANVPFMSSSVDSFWWVRFAWTPRINWIKKHIKKLEDGVQ